ncbi:hypothetical protein ACFWPA_04185 [Rhodococcus sp. NPDC058505]|uniref:hypothetical protein n=1 Tax=unclassified Rhodococcus (in: high G+C Gram-positive bacteria) TaxID=192944 RepID=UPI00364D4ED2
MNPVRGLAMCAAVAAAFLTTTGVASAAAAVPFQVAPAPFGNPNGSFDVPAIRCATVVGERPGDLTITGSMPGRWGCLINAEARWLNLSTGASGTARLSDGLHGYPPEATVHTGAGQVAVVLIPLPGSVTPGVAAVAVP